MEERRIANEERSQKFEEIKHKDKIDIDKKKLNKPKTAIVTGKQIGRAHV